MAVDRRQLLSRAGNAQRESRHLDFKREFDVASNEAWCELIKDIVAFANSGGGIIVFGIENDGDSSGDNCAAVLAYDIADITNKIFKYTGYQFSDIETTEVERSGASYPALVIAVADVPIVFTKPGTYDVGGGKQKTAFAQGTIYFRHGGKSEPGNRDDLVAWHDRELSKHRRSLLQGMRKVVEAPPGHTVVVAPEGAVTIGNTTGLEARITTDPNATRVTIFNTDELWPHRQKDLLKAVNDQLPDGVHHINGFDLLCVNRKIDVLKARPDFAHKPHKLASPQYNDAYAHWIIAQAKANPHYFEECRQEYRQKNTVAPQI